MRGNQRPASSCLTGFFHFFSPSKCLELAIGCLLAVHFSLLKNPSFNAACLLRTGPRQASAWWTHLPNQASGTTNTSILATVFFSYMPIRTPTHLWLKLTNVLCSLQPVPFHHTDASDFGPGSVVHAQVNGGLIQISSQPAIH